MKPDYSLCLVTNRLRMSTSTLDKAVEQAILGGCTMIQLREKNSASLDFYHLCRNISVLSSCRLK